MAAADKARDAGHRMTLVTWWVPGAMALVGLVLLVLGLIGWRRAGRRGPDDTRFRSMPLRPVVDATTASPKGCEENHGSRLSVHIEGDTIVDAFRNTVRRIPDRPALRRRVGSRWEALTWADYGRAVSEVTAGLTELGIGPGQQVGIFSNNRVEWHLADFGTLANGSVTVPLYQTSSPEQVAYVLGHAEAARVLRREPRPGGKVLEVRDQLPKLDHVVVFDDDERLDDPFVSGFEQLRAVGAARLRREPGVFDSRADTVAARRAGDARVHERHDRAAQRGDDQPCQHHVDAPQLRGRGGRPRGRTLPVLPALEPHRRAHDQRLSPGGRRWRYLVRPQSGDGRGRLARLSSDGVLRGAACLGEVPRGRRWPSWAKSTA